MPFPEGFWWGTAASSTQSEGAAPRSDWERWEELGRAPASGEGNGFGHRYAEDFRLLAEHGLTHHRVSIEWARIEPEAGRVDPDAVEHYRAVLLAARAAGVEPWVCLHHFTLPGWFADDEGGFVDDRARSLRWQRHVAFCAETFGDLVFGWQPINEPAAYAANGFLFGTFPPGLRSFEEYGKAYRGIMLAGRDAWRELRGAGTPVATVHNLIPVMAAAGTDRARRAAERFDEAVFRVWIRALREGVLAVPGRAEEEVADLEDSCDLVGFSYYGATAFDDAGNQAPYPPDARTNALGYAPWSEGIRHVIDRIGEELPGRPLLVAEHGVGTEDDAWRVDVLRESLTHVSDAIADGADVRGFFHWTAVDNYEWLHGFDVPFGLFDRDRNPRASAELLASLANSA